MIFISHKLRGSAACVGPHRGASRRQAGGELGRRRRRQGEELAELMVGREVAMPMARAHVPGPVACELVGVGVDTGTCRRVADIMRRRDHRDRRSVRQRPGAAGGRVVRSSRAGPGAGDAGGEAAYWLPIRRHGSPRGPRAFPKTGTRSAWSANFPLWENAVLERYRTHSALRGWVRRQAALAFAAAPGGRTLRRARRPGLDTAGSLAVGWQHAEADSRPGSAARCERPAGRP